MVRDSAKNSLAIDDGGCGAGKRATGLKFKGSGSSSGAGKKRSPSLERGRKPVLSSTSRRGKNNSGFTNSSSNPLFVHSKDAVSCVNSDDCQVLDTVNSELVPVDGPVCHLRANNLGSVNPLLSDSLGSVCPIVDNILGSVSPISADNLGSVRPLTVDILGPVCPVSADISVNMDNTCDPPVVASLEEFPPLDSTTGKSMNKRRSATASSQRLSAKSASGDYEKLDRTIHPAAPLISNGNELVSDLAPPLGAVAPLQGVSADDGALANDFVEGEGAVSKMPHLWSEPNKGENVMDDEMGQDVQMRKNIEDLLDSEKEAMFDQNAAPIYTLFPDSEEGKGAVSGTKEKNKEEAGSGKAWVRGDSEKLFKTNRQASKEVRLKYTPIYADIVEIPDHGISHEWDFTLIGYFTGRFPGIGAVHSICKSWGVKYTLKSHDSGWLLFKLMSEEDVATVLGGGPYSKWGRMLMLKRMPMGFHFDNFEISLIPVWIKLPHLPLCCWNSTAIGLICSKIGRPLHTDKMTFSKERVSYVRALVEVDASKPLVRDVSFSIGGFVMNQFVEYEFEPRYCIHCGKFGHDDGECLRNERAANVSNNVSNNYGGAAYAKNGKGKGQNRGKTWVPTNAMNTKTADDEGFVEVKGKKAARGEKKTSPNKGVAENTMDEDILFSSGRFDALSNGEPEENRIRLEPGPSYTNDDGTQADVGAVVFSSKPLKGASYRGPFKAAALDSALCEAAAAALPSGGDQLFVKDKGKKQISSKHKSHKHKAKETRVEGGNVEPLGCCDDAVNEAVNGQDPAHFNIVEGEQQDPPLDVSEFSPVTPMEPFSHGERDVDAGFDAEQEMSEAQQQAVNLKRSVSTADASRSLHSEATLIDGECFVVTKKKRRKPKLKDKTAGSDGENVSPNTINQ